jgi:transposase
MDRDVLTDAQWAKMEPHCLGKPSDPGRSGRNNRLFMEAVLWVARTGSPWRDLPERFGNWSTAFRRFRDWREADVFRCIFDALSEEPDMEYAMVDATIVKVHRHGQGAKGGLRARPLAVPKAA